MDTKSQKTLLLGLSFHHCPLLLHESRCIQFSRVCTRKHYTLKHSVGNGPESVTITDSTTQLEISEVSAVGQKRWKKMDRLQNFRKRENVWVIGQL